MTIPPEHIPADCHFCGKHAIGLGIGPNPKDPRWLCAECSLILEDFKKIKRADAYEIRALDGGDASAENYCADIGKTDMADMDDLERRMLWKAVWDGCANELRRLVRNQEAPF
jgi:hypothetical protein